ncbi:unnamed protein product [Phaedon cochleariae]|uniref:Glycoprotein-N-acetylgalactosamine 3-beta-galactosyltransferase 1 n=1 Tax=Phaedon cochleariae TaxID=80249 RepID=A0A9N9S7B4_PHACE|nr:unnamed protein product [Phaedon cochleariae]
MLNQSHFCLLIGLVMGFTIAFVVIAPNTLYRPKNEYFSFHPRSGQIDDSPEHPGPHGHDHENFEFHNKGGLKHFIGPNEHVSTHNDNDTFHKMTNSLVADDLFKKVRVLCWVMTGPENHEKKAKHVKATWGKRCNTLLFMSSKADESLPVVTLPVEEGRNNLWGKTKHAFEYIYNNHFDDADWFMKADDDTYVILENLRYMLYPVDNQIPIYYGLRFKPFTKQGYMSGGAGYVLSKEALRRFIVIPTPTTEFLITDTARRQLELTASLYTYQSPTIRI